MRCPHCRCSLAPVMYEGVAIHTCNGCGGEFASAEALTHIVRVRERRFGPELAASVADAAPAFGVPDEERSRRLACPACENPMRSFNYAVDSGVHVDRCLVCQGVWLDRDELEKVQALMERWQDEAPAKIRAVAGDLERARREAAAAGAEAFAGSRFAFLNALVNRIMDAA